MELLERDVAKEDERALKCAPASSELDLTSSRLSSSELIKLSFGFS
jgi:hypothetical protein